MVRLGMAAAALALMASPLLAQESTEQLKKELQELRAEVDALKAVNTTKEIPSSGKVAQDAMAADDSPVMTLFKQTKLSGFVAASYQFHFNGLHSDNVGNPIRLFDERDNSFYLNTAHLQLERLASKDMIVGYHIELDAGHDSERYDGRSVTLQEGWVQIMAPLGDGLDIRAGRMATLAGYEVLESPNNLNTSRGMLFTFVQPFTHTGVRASYAFGDKVSATIGLNNGLNFAGDPFADDDHGKMVEAQLALKPIKDLSASLTVLFGNDTGTLSQGPGDKFYLFDIVVAYTMDKLTLALNVDFASIQATLGNNRAALSGFAAYAKYQVTDSFAGALRFEYMSDEDGLFGFSGPVVGGDSGTGSRYLGVTLTAEMKVAQQLILRFEIRSDNSNNHNFTRGNDDGAPKAARGDTSLGFEAIMPF